MNQNDALLTRRAFLAALLTLPAPLILAACAQPTAPTSVPTNGLSTAAPPTQSPTQLPATEAFAPTTAPTQVAQLEPTPACGDDDDDEPTLAQTEGPYYTPNTPERASLLEAGMTGTKLTVTGLVLTTGCQPVARALIDFWQCDDAGVYDNAGYRLRGHQFTDEQGRYQLETIEPGNYPGRTKHIHVKVQAPNQPVLTTQLYFPNEPRNANDGIYRPELEMVLGNNTDGSKSGAFDFVLNI